VIQSDDSSLPRVTVIIDSFLHANAGTENQLAKIVRGLSGSARIEVITLRESPWLQANADALGIKATLMPIDGVRRLRSYRTIYNLIKHLRDTCPQVVHTFFPIANVLGVVAARVANVPAIYSSRRDYGEWMTPRYLAATRLANRFVTAIIANSKRVAELTCTRERLSAARVRVIHNGIDLTPFAELSRSVATAHALAIPDQATVIGLVANYRPMKRHETLVRALPLVLRQHPDAHVLFVGANMTPEDIESRVRALSEHLGVAERVHQVHADGNVTDYLGLIDIGINCSEGEGLSNAIMEYMAAGIPVIAADSGGNPDLVTHERNGLLFALDDHEALADAINALISAPELRRSLARKARQFVAEEFSIPSMLNRFAVEYGIPIR
jgi:glycosyltransferase involved in cell wall biosynthesis